MTSRRGTILVVVLVTLIFAATALAAFLDKASNDLLVDSRSIVANRLRPDAYSALEVALAVLEDFSQADHGLHSPAGEGWGSNQSWGNLYNLPWVQWAPADGTTVDIDFQDESGKISLNSLRAGQNAQMVQATIALFQNWGMNQDDAEHLVDVLLSWMSPNPNLPSVAPPPDYEEDPVPYDPPDRALRSYEELRSIDFAKDIFFDPQGRPTDLYWRFRNDFSLFNYRSPDINGANPDVLAAVGQFTPDQVQNISDYMAMKGNFVTPNPLGAQWFTSDRELSQVAGPGGTPGLFGTSIVALRILITVHQGSTVFHLDTVVAPAQGGATTVETNATEARQNANAASSGNSTANAVPTSTNYGPRATPTNAQTAAANGTNLRFPFTILEIRENDEIVTAPTELSAAPSVTSPSTPPAPSAPPTT